MSEYRGEAPPEPSSAPSTLDRLRAQHERIRLICADQRQRAAAMRRDAEQLRNEARRFHLANPVDTEDDPSP